MEEMEEVDKFRVMICANGGMREVNHRKESVGIVRLVLERE